MCASTTMALSNPKTSYPESNVQMLRELLFGQNFKAYLVLDRARDPKIGQLLSETKSEHETLYGGKLADQLAEFGPVLVKIDESESLIETFCTAAWPQAWGIIVMSKLEFETVRNQLRRLLGVEMPDGGRALFRFYDPRVLRAFLPTCTPQERKLFFGNVIHSFLIEHPEENGTLEITALDQFALHPPLPSLFE